MPESSDFPETGLIMRKLAVHSFAVSRCILAVFVCFRLFPYFKIDPALVEDLDSVLPRLDISDSFLARIDLFWP